MTLPHLWTDRDGIAWEVTVARVRPSIQRDTSPPLTTVHLTAGGMRYSGMTMKPVDVRTNLVPAAELQRILDEGRNGRASG